MARLLKEQEFITRRNEILDAAQRFIYTKGYEQMSIQDILDQLRISKGAFYHYFDSKPALLEALIERLGEEGSTVMLPIVENANLPALDKLARVFGAIAQWKMARKDLLMAILRVWYADDNAIVRQKVTTNGFKTILPLLGRIIQQGVREGVMETPYTDQIGGVLMSLMVGMGDATAGMLLELDASSSEAERLDCFTRMTGAVEAYTHAVERVLGAPTGSITFIEPNLLREWTQPAFEAMTLEGTIDSGKESGG